ncbi:MAG: hypothetical protein NTX65_17235 [Ignavibacteriales bacterium]|nr:hypothetical protein [Ignavibacteriales bacterium]
MKLILPKNIYSSILISELQKNEGFEISYKESPLISKDLEFNTSAIALIPSLDLINHRNLFVSNKLALAFDGALSNSYFHFIEGEKKIEKIYLRGDVSLNEILLTKILFSERYSANLEISLDPSKNVEKGKDFLVVGDENFTSWNVQNALSLADEASELLEYPYVNYVFASPDREALQKFNESVNAIDPIIEDQIEKIIDLLNISREAKSFITQNIGSLYFDMTDNELNAVNELIRLIFFHGIIEDMFDVKFL